jgi:hypothetical protein
MRISGLAVLSTAHMPPAERGTIESLIAAAAIVDGRQTIAFQASRHESGESVRLLRTYPELRLI